MVFMDEKSFEQVQVAAKMIGESSDLMKDNMPCQVLFFNERPVDVTLPTFVVLEVSKAEPGVRGDTSGNVTKAATLETGASVAVPLFINVGDMLKIDTRTHEYVERINKK
jgi:elongation factor P